LEAHQELLDEFRKDALVSFLMDKCSLTQVQVDTLMISRTEGNLREKARLRDKKVSKGSFARTLKQCKSNVEASLYTLILLQYLGLIREESLTNLSRIGVLVSKIRENSPDAETIRKLVQVIDSFGREFSH
jgi:hypothetical protein